MNKENQERSSKPKVTFRSKPHSAKREGTERKERGKRRERTSEEKKSNPDSHNSQGKKPYKRKPLSQAELDYREAKNLLFTTKPKPTLLTEAEREVEEKFSQLLKEFGMNDEDESKDDAEKEGGSEVELLDDETKLKITTKVHNKKQLEPLTLPQFSQRYIIFYLLVYQYSFALENDFSFTLDDVVDFDEDSPFLKLVETVFNPVSLKRTSIPPTSITSPEQNILATHLPSFLATVEKRTKYQEEITSQMATLLAEVEASDDEFIPYLKKWSWERISLSKKAILRLARYHMVHEKLSAKYVINESVNLAKWFGEEKDYGFVNAILEAKFIK